MFRFISGLFLLILAQSVFAIDPIRWSLSSPFPNEIFVSGGAYSVTYTFTSRLPFTMRHPFVIEKTSSPQSEFTYDDQCTGLKLAPGQSCTVTILLDAIVVGPKEVQLIISGYDHNRVPLPKLFTSAIQQNGRINIIGDVIKPLPSSMFVDSSATYVFRFTNTGTETATGVGTTTNQRSFSTTCHATLLPGASCAISGTFTPTSTTPSLQTVTGTFFYAQGDSVTVSTQTNVTPKTGLTGVISGLPAITIVGGSYQVTYTFTNNNSSDMQITANLQQTFVGTNCPNTPGCTYLPQANTCPVVNGTLPAGTSCYMTGLFRPDAPGAYGPFTSTLAAANANPGPTSSTLSTSTTTVPAGGARKINFVNECTFPVWFSMNGGALHNSPSCKVDAECPSGTACDPSANAGSGLCFWINPTPPPHSPSGGPVSPYELLPLGSGFNTNSVVVPVAPPNIYDQNTQWSGNVSASALCNGTNFCQIADCNNKGGSASCAVGQGFAQPATQFEITMLKNDRDFYDVEVINGFHLPIEVTPINPYSTGDQFNCGIPGDPVPNNGFGACNWNAAVPPPPTYAYFWVTSGGASCTSTADCTPGQLCGLDNNLDRQCGAFLGYWSADQACGVNPNKAAVYFQCTNYLTSPPYAPNMYQLTALYGCTTPNANQSTLNSCYLFNAADCCGCANWDQYGIMIPSTTKKCLNTSNNNWTNQVQPKIQWMKAACPSYYTYPYDDASSTFRCSNVASGSNSVGYTVTFCAGGITGLPAGAIEGR